MTLATRDTLKVLADILYAPSACSECVAFCSEGRIDCECKGVFHPETCEHSLIYSEEMERGVEK